MSNVPLLAEPNYTAGGLSFLQMVQRLRQEAGVSGNGPVTVASQSGEYKRLVEIVRVVGGPVLLGLTGRRVDCGARGQDQYQDLEF